MPDDTPIFGVAQRLPPSNIRAEQSLLGTVLANNKAIDRCAGLEPHHFADPVAGRIFEEVRRLTDAGQLADAVTLKNRFEHSGVLEEVGGTQYLTQLLSAMVSPLNVGDYARVVRDCWLRRELIDVGAQAADLAYGADTAIDGEGAVTATLERLLALGENSGASQGNTLAEAVAEALALAEAAYKGEHGSSGLMTGIDALDAIHGGLWPACLDFLAARSEHGKTALGMQIATNVARTLLAEHEAMVAAGRSHKPGHVQVFSLEMKRDNLARRMLSAETGIPAREIRGGNIGGERSEALFKAQAALKKLPMIIQDKPGMALSEILMAARVSHRRKNVRLIVIDHLHRILPDKSSARAPRNEQVQHMTKALKDLSNTLNIPILLLAQLSRHVDRREDQRPVVSDIEYAGEQDADNILLLWRPELYMGARPPTLPDRLSEEKKTEANNAWWKRREECRGRAEIIIAKARNGPVASSWLDFDGPRMSFNSPAQADDPQERMF